MPKKNILLKFSQSKDESLLSLFFPIEFLLDFKHSSAALAEKCQVSDCIKMKMSIEEAFKLPHAREHHYILALWEGKSSLIFQDFDGIFRVMGRYFTEERIVVSFSIDIFP